MGYAAAAAALALGLLTWPALADGPDALKSANSLVKAGEYAQAQAQYQRTINDAAGDAARLAPLLLARADAYFAAGRVRVGRRIRWPLRALYRSTMSSQAAPPRSTTRSPTSCRGGTAMLRRRSAWCTIAMSDIVTRVV